MSKNIYGKLQDIRVELQGRDIKKSGQNKFAGYSYYELGDYLPTINELMQKHGVTTITQFTAELATMRVVDIDTGESVEFTSPMGSANLKGCHEVQNIGAVETYQRRYLYQVAFEIVEHDALDGTLDPKQQPKKTDQGKSELEQLGSDMKEVLTELAKKADKSIVDGYRTDGIKLYQSGNIEKLSALIGKIKSWEETSDPVEAAKRVFTDDLPEEIF